jgi:hypothetical protein
VTQDSLASVRHAISALRSRIRREWAVRGFAIVASVACAAALVSFAMDWFLDLPTAVRAVHLVIVLGCLAYVTERALLRPLRTPTTEHDLAQALEHGAPELHDRLLSALDFEKRMADAGEPESRELMAGVVRDAGAAAARLDPSLLVDTRPARRALGAFACAAVALAVVAWTMPDSFALWLRRGVLLGDVAWPRRTHIRLLDFPDKGPRIVTRGDDLRLVAVAEGDHPPELVLHYEELADPDPEKGEDAPTRVTYVDTRRMHPIDGEEGRYAFDFHAVSASFRVWATGGDDQDEMPVYDVVALVPPRVAKIAGKVIHPSYTGLPDRTVTEATIDVLRDSRVEFDLTTNMPVTAARIVPAESAQVTDVPVGADGRSLHLSFELAQSVDFHLELVAARGQTNRADDDVFHLRATDDRAPDLRTLYPPARLYRTPTGIVPVKYVVKDDLRVAKVTLGLVHGTTTLGSAVLWPPAGDPPAPTTRVDGYFGLDLRDFNGDSGPQLKPGDVLHLTLTAEDSRGNTAASGDLAVEILSVEDFELRLSQKQGTLREDLAVVLRAHQRATAALAELRKALSSAAPDAAALGHGRDVQVDEGRVGNDVAQFLGGIRQVFDSYVLDRVGTGPTIDKLLPIYKEELQRPSEDEVFPESLYARIVEERRTDRIYDPEILGALLDIMDLGDRAVVTAAPAVYKALQSWGSETGHPAELLAQAEKAAAELTSLLVQIDQRMQRWGDLNLLIEIARDIRNTEDNLSKDPAGTKGLAPK